MTKRRPAAARARSAAARKGWATRRANAAAAARQAAAAARARSAAARKGWETRRAAAVAAEAAARRERRARAARKGWETRKARRAGPPMPARPAAVLGPPDAPAGRSEAPPPRPFRYDMPIEEPYFEEIADYEGAFDAVEEVEY